jgi:hypothetical protein
MRRRYFTIPASVAKFYAVTRAIGDMTNVTSPGAPLKKSKVVQQSGSIGASDGTLYVGADVTGSRDSGQLALCTADAQMFTPA